jgi:hypothetical protein
LNVGYVYYIHYQSVRSFETATYHLIPLNNGSNQLLSRPAVMQAAIFAETNSFTTKMYIHEKLYLLFHTHSHAGQQPPVAKQLFILQW